MATPSTTPAPQPADHHEAAALLVYLPLLTADQAPVLLANLAAAFRDLPVDVVLTDAPNSGHGESLPTPASSMRVSAFSPTLRTGAAWSLSAADFLNLQQVLAAHPAQAILLLGADPQMLSVPALKALAGPAVSQTCDLTVARYDQTARASLVNSAVLYPLSRALFGAAPRFPLAIDLGLSPRMAERLATAAQRLATANQPEGLLWPVAEAASVGFSIAQAAVGARGLPQPEVPDLNTLLVQVTGSLFTDLDAKAAYWQRARNQAPAPLHGTAAFHVGSPTEEIQPMVEGYRLACSNLQEVWSLVLPPQSLLGLKRLSALDADAFLMPDSLWARIVYDFLLAHHLRTINRGHLLGAFTPLYLAWVASHLRQTSDGVDPERHIAAVAAAFEADKPYLVARWRWPDRFNP